MRSCSISEHTLCVYIYVYVSLAVGERVREELQHQRAHAGGARRYSLLYFCFTAALLLLYCCFTAALLLLQRADAGDARGNSPGLAPQTVHVAAVKQA